MTYKILPPDQLIEDARISLPLSKSLSTRALILESLAGQKPADAGALLECDDTEVMANAIDLFNASPTSPIECNVKASGAALRFLTAFFAAQPGSDVVLTGIERLCKRPVRQLVDALRQCGAQIDYVGQEGFAPLHIHGKSLVGGRITIDATVSSQFISALLMIAPLMEQGLVLDLEGEPVSMPYILMTLDMMQQRGAVTDRQPLQITVAPGRYVSVPLRAEGDWSASAFWYEISALAASWITIDNLTLDTLQGDKAAADFFARVGVDTLPSEDVAGALELTPSPEIYGRVELDMSDNPDLAPALAITCCVIGVPFRLTGLQTLSGKECDRLQAVADEMDKIGRNVEKIRDYGLEWTGASHPVVELPEFSAHGDHRMAMALAPIAIYVPGITIAGAESVSKSYPGYWDDLRKLGFVIEAVEE